jgi:4-hydroxybenzoate polyprenyltransferase
MPTAYESRIAIKESVRILRPHQYLKNLFIFAPLFFAGRINEPSLLAKTLLLFMAFCCVSSAGYIFNDYNDREADRLHPRKRYRPFASEKLGKRFAFAAIAFLLTFGFGLALSFVSIEVVGITAVYFILSVFYTLKLKHMPVIDVFVIALFFLIRVFAGSTVTDVFLSAWLILITFLLSIFLALAKRRDDVLIYLGDGTKARKAVDGYNLEFLNTAMAVMAAVCIVAYIMYTLSSDIVAKFHSDKLYLSTLFVILGFLRYLQITLVKNDSGSPTEVLLKDRVIQLSIISWVWFFALIIYIR